MSDLRMIPDAVLVRFLMESNFIEGVYEEITDDTLRLVREAMKKPLVDFHTIKMLAWVFAGAPIRHKLGMNARVGGRVCPAGGPTIETALEWLLKYQENCSPKLLHDAYLWLHPFMDGNGRTSRLLWLHRMLMLKQSQIIETRSFLHEYYYQSLSSGNQNMKDFWTVNNWSFA